MLSSLKRREQERNEHLSGEGAGGGFTLCHTLHLADCHVDNDP